MEERPLARAWAGYQGRPFVGISLPGTARYLAYAALLVASLMFYTWSRVDVRARSASLESAQIELANARVEQDRLTLEIATRRDLARVGLGAGALGLVDDVAIIEVANR